MKKSILSLFSTFLFVVGFSMSLGNALAQNSIDTDKEIAKCSIVEGDLSRLECFDLLSKNRGLDKPKDVSTPIEGSGAWVVSEDINPVDDTKKVTLILLPEESGKSRWGDSPILILRCQSNTTELFVNWSAYLGQDAYVLTRIGNEKAETKEWSVSSDSKASFYPTSPISFIKKMMGHDKLVIQVTPYSENPITAIFNTAGLKNALKPLQEACDWE